MEWHCARLGIPTASNFAAIVTPTGKPTANAARQTYKCELLAERMTGQLTSHFVSAAMERGTELEPQARAWYQLETNKPIKSIGFVQLDTGAGLCGASPDGMAADRGLEVKCPLNHTIIGQLLADVPPLDYIMQCQAGMWVTGVVRWDLVLFSGTSGIPNRIYELRADERLFAAFETCIPAFCAELAAAEAKLVAMGGRARWLEPQENGADIMGDE